MNTQVTSRQPSEQSSGGIDWKVVVRLALLTVLLPLTLLASAGRLDWWQAWVYLFVMLGVSFLSRYLVFRKNPELIAERARFISSEGVKSWDKLLVLIISLVGPLATFVVAGLDKRNSWSPDISLGWQITASVFFLLGATLVTWAMVENAFFSSVVRIQRDRGQTVVTSGPYRMMRHPSYTGAILSWLVTPVMLGTLWAFIPAFVILVVIIVRTALEDRALHAELPGYRDYAQRTRYRLLPGVW